jgi:hypothetical protein
MTHPSKAPKEKLSCRLLVEGGADFHFFSHLFVKRGLYEKPGNQVIPKGFEVRASGDWRQVIDGLVQLKENDLDALGIIVDADLNLQDRWKDIRKTLNELELDYELEDEPDRLGSIVFGKKRLGVWVMPNNRIEGILENFIAWMVQDKDNNRLWQHVEESIKTLPNGPRFDPEKNLAKAQIATWLAWQKEPGHPIGLAVSMGYVDAHSPTVDNFINWIKRLFQL